MSQRICIRLRQPEGLAATEVQRVLLRADSGLKEDAAFKATEDDDVLRSTTDTWLQFGMLVIGAIGAAKTIYELAQLVRAKKSEETKDQPIKHYSQTNIQVIINGSAYDAEEMTTKQLDKLLEE